MCAAAPVTDGVAGGVELPSYGVALVVGDGEECGCPAFVGGGILLFEDFFELLAFFVSRTIWALSPRARCSMAGAGSMPENID